jgi:pyruvate dehydrogenase E1 component beta subunit
MHRLIRSIRKGFAEKPKVSVRQALKLAMEEEMERNPNVILIGEEVAVYQGAYKISAGMLQKFGPERVIDTPITEAGFTGISVGASLNGVVPIVEFMTWNFALQAIDHIVNSCAKIRYMSGGDIHGAIVFRGLNGPAASVGAQHSQCFAAWYSNIPGLKVVSPFDSNDCKMLLKAAIREKGPVVFLENELMYSKEFEVDEEFYDVNAIQEIGKAKIMREGTDCTLISFSRMVGECLEAAEQLEKEGISVEVINLRTIRPLDRETIIKSVIKTGRAVAVEDGYPQSGVTAEILSTIIESPAFDYLDAPPERITAWDIPLAYAKTLESATIPQVENIIKGVRKTLIGTNKTRQ